MIEIVSILAGLIVAFVAGRKYERRRRSVVVFFAAPRDDVDIDIPKPQDARRWVS